MLLCLTWFFGCSSGVDERADRVAIEVTVQIGGVPANDGILVLRPDSGTKGPLIQISIKAGTGSLPQEKGPVPGQYAASWRNSEADITTVLSADTKRQPSSVTALPKNTPTAAKTATQLTVQETTVMTIPTTNPAVVTVNFGTDG